MSSGALTKIAFIGTGLMGAPMTQRLLAAGYSMRVWNRTPPKLERLIAAGAVPARSPAEAASEADAVFICVTDGAAVEAVLFAGDGVASAAHPAPLLVDFSTIGPAATLRLAEPHRARDLPARGGAGSVAQGSCRVDRIVFAGPP